MSLTETSTRIFRVTCDAAGRVERIEVQQITEVIREDVGADGQPTRDVLNREATAPEVIDADALAILLAPEDRASLAAALAAHAV